MTLTVITSTECFLEIKTQCDFSNVYDILNCGKLLNSDLIKDGGSHTKKTQMKFDGSYINSSY